ncbi:hypothetical protein EPI10_000927 [Gossypium australe]|uniref:Uncharacterized protein n=1 Tax=Gossypium australe TaxID=47621 RepID=A0A5B6V9Z3_9ROSI|nr:hypothetical protein EPI10_000927 [Gossypium australe]
MFRSHYGHYEFLVMPFRLTDGSLLLCVERNCKKSLVNANFGSKKSNFSVIWFQLKGYELIRARFL